MPDTKPDSDTILKPKSAKPILQDSKPDSKPNHESAKPVTQDSKPDTKRQLQSDFDKWHEQQQKDFRKFFKTIGLHSINTPLCYFSGSGLLLISTGFLANVVHLTRKHGRLLHRESFRFLWSGAFFFTAGTFYLLSGFAESYDASKYYKTDSNHIENVSDKTKMDKTRTDIRETDDKK